MQSLRHKTMFRSESEFVRWLQKSVPGQGSRVRLGIGDDAALVRVKRGQELILTTDMSLEGVHFLRRLHPPQSVGHRALARSLSDIAAMGGSPCYALVSLALSKGTERRWVEELYAGMSALARRSGVAVIGGDTAVVSGGTMIDVLVVGEVPRGKALRRSGARPGDELWVSGSLGLSALGLRLLKSPARRRARGEAAAIRAHLYPEPQCALGRFLAEKRVATALIDLSDGLSTDLARLCEASGVGARVWAERLPGPNVPDPGESLDLALHGGEDYQLLFTARPQKALRIPPRFRGLPLRRIGEIQRSKGLQLVERTGKLRPLAPAGWDYFRKT
jgi:thiamine-monophosphate kinase